MASPKRSGNVGPDSPLPATERTHIFLARLRTSLSQTDSQATGWRDIFETLLDQLSDDPSLSPRRKLDELEGLRRLIDETLRGLTPQMPNVAPKLWMDRPARQKDPVQFVVDTYGDFLGMGLAQADIRRLDPQLYAALQNWKHRKGWPAGFSLPTRKEVNDEQIASLTAEERRENRRISEALRNRTRRNT